jgi:hypothetical protein
MVVGPFAVMEVTGNGFTITVTEAIEVQPSAFLTVTEYVPAWLTVMEAVVAPLLHK